jgi:ribosome biogenesis GTPase
MTVKGIIIRGIAGNFYVKTDEGIYTCRARGLFRKDNIKPLVGDHVHIDITDEADMEGYLKEIEERRNELIRPHVANVDQVIIMMSASHPAPNFILLDKLMILAQHNGLEPIICFNKMDIESKESIETIGSIYADAGYHVVLTSAKTEVGIEALRDLMKDHINVFAGPSGVGKSTVINALMPGLKLKTGEISEKIKRGKHTTRHSELIALDFGGFVLDTPGFTSLDLTMIDLEDIRHYYREFEDLEPCHFANCLHINEPKCRVKEAQKEGTVSTMRYKAYLYIANEIAERKEKF